MKILSGLELVGYIKQRQLHQVRSLIQTHGIQPKLVIIRTNSDPIVDRYMKLKSAYGLDIEVAVEVKTIKQNEAIESINLLNKDKSVHGIIVQIPLPDRTQTDEILNAVTQEKDVDGLGQSATLTPATPMAINWLLAGYNIELKEKNIVIVGHGRLVGKPLLKLWQSSGYNVSSIDSSTTNLAVATLAADVLVCATGVPGLITANMVKNDAVIVDAGVATDKNGLVGDVALDVRELPNVTITPEKGGVGPLTVAALFENLIIAARQQGVRK